MGGSLSIGGSVDFDFDLHTVPLLGVANLPDTRLAYGNPTIQAVGIQASGNLLTIYPSEPLSCPTGEETLGLSLTVLGIPCVLTFVSNTGNVITFSFTPVASSGVAASLEYELSSGSWVSERTGYPLSNYDAAINNGSTQNIPYLVSGSVAADGVTVSLVFSTPVVFTGSQTLGVTIKGNGVSVPFTFVSVVSNVVTYLSGTVIEVGQSASYAYTGSGTMQSVGGVAVPLIAETAITNNSMQDPSAAFVSGAIAADGVTVTVVLDNNIAVPSGDKTAGFTCVTYGYTQALTYSGYATDTPIAGQSTITFTVPGKARVGDACTIAYAPGNWVIDPLSATSLTNNSAVAAFSAQASSVFSTMPTSSALAPVLRDKMAAFVDSQQTAGNWAKINDFQCYYVTGDLMTDQSNALAGWKGTDGTLQNSATWFSTTGVVFDAASEYVNTNLAPVSQNSQAFGMKLGTVTSLVGPFYMFGLRNGATMTKLVRPQVDASGRIDSYSINSGPEAVGTLTALASNDALMIIRTGAAACEYKLNNVSKDVGTAASDVITGSPVIHINGYNNGGTHANGGGTWNCKAFVSLDPAGFDFASFQTDLTTLCG